MKNIVGTMLRGAGMGLVLMLASAAHAAPETERSAETSPAPDRRNGTLANGLTYAIERTGPAGGNIEFNLIVRVGDAFAYPREQSAAHVVEHILVSGGSGPNSNIARIASFGGRFGTNLNGTTASDMTSYWLAVPAGNPEALSVGLSIVRGWILPRDFTDEEIARERQAVIEETRRRTPDAMRFENIQQRARYAGHPVMDVRLDPAGTLSASPATIRALYRDWYRPSNMAIIITGDFDPEAMLLALQKGVETVERGPPSPPPPDLRRETLGGGGYYALAQPAPSETKLQLSHSYRPAPSGTPERAKEYAVMAVARRLLQTAASNITEPYASPVTALAISLSDPNNNIRASGAGIASVSVSVRPRQLREGLTQILALLDVIGSKGFDRTDFERARAEEVAALSSPRQSAGAAATAWTERFLQGTAEPSPAEILAATNTLSVDDLNAKLRTWLAPDHRDIFLVYPEADARAVPEPHDLPSIIAAAKKMARPQLGPPVVVEPVLAPLSVPAANTPAPAIEDGGYARWQLPRSGATLLYRRRKGASTELVMLRPGGAARFAASRVAEILASGSVAGFSGLGGIDGPALGRFLRSRKIDIDPSIDRDREGLRARAPVGEWSLLLQLVRTQLVQPQCTEAAFDHYVDQRRMALANIPPDIAAQDAFGRFVENALGQTWRLGEGDLNRLNYQSVCQAYKIMLGDTEGMTILIEADLDPGEVYAGVVAALDIRGQHALPTLRSQPVAETTAQRDTIRLGDLETASVLVFVQRSIDGSAPAGELVGSILGKRLHHRLREIEGGTYSVLTDFAVSRDPGRGTLSVGFDCDPANVDRLVAAVREEIVRLRLEGVSVAEIDAAKQEIVARPEMPSDVAERWIEQGNLTRAPTTVDEADIAAWIEQFADLGRLREFVRLPKN